MFAANEPHRTTPVCIFSVSDPAAFKVWALEQGDVPHKDVLGCYKGERERSFLVLAQHIQQIALAGWLDDQESVLFLSGQESAREPRQAFIWLLEEGSGRVGHVEALGEWHAVSENEARLNDAWTFDPLARNYWIARQPEAA